MSIKRVTRQELKNVANDLFGLLIADVRDELAELRAENERLRESIVALNSQQLATDSRLKSEFARSQESRKGILKRLAEVENAARSVS